MTKSQQVSTKLPADNPHVSPTADVTAPSAPGEDPAKAAISPTLPLDTTQADAEPNDKPKPKG